MEDKVQKKVENLGVGKYKVELAFNIQCYLYIVKGKGKEPIRLYSNINFKQEYEEDLEAYLKRQKIEEYYKGNHFDLKK